MQQRWVHTFCTEFIRSRVDKLNRFWNITNFFVAQQPYWDQAASLLRFRDHTQIHHTRKDSSGRVIDPSQRSLPDNMQHSQQTDIHVPVEFEPAIPSIERLQTYALTRAAIEFGHYNISLIFIRSYFIFIRIIFHFPVTYKLYILDVFRAPICQSVQINETTEQTEH